MQVLPRRGYFAIQLDEKQLEEIHDVRLLLELYAIEKCVADKRGIEGFREMYETLQKKAESTDRHRRRESLKLDKQLHLQIINNCNNSKVQKLFLEICDLIELCQAIRDQKEEQVFREHLATASLRIRPGPGARPNLGQAIVTNYEHRFCNADDSLWL